MFKRILLIVLAVVLGYFLIDVFGFASWVISCQTPQSGYYLGMITAKITNYQFDGFNGRNYINYGMFNPETGELIK